MHVPDWVVLEKMSLWKFYEKTFSEQTPHVKDLRGNSLAVFVLIMIKNGQ